VLLLVKRSNNRNVLNASGTSKFMIAHGRLLVPMLRFSLLFHGIRITHG
jgi:hypothetical protein